MFQTCVNTFAPSVWGEMIKEGIQSFGCQCANRQTGSHQGAVWSRPLKMRDLSVAVTNDEDIWLHDNKDCTGVYTNVSIYKCISMAELCK